MVGLDGLSGVSNHNDSVILCAGGNCLRLRKSRGKSYFWVEIIHTTGQAGLGRTQLCIMDCGGHEIHCGHLHLSWSLRLPLWQIENYSLLEHDPLTHFTCLLLDEVLWSTVWTCSQTPGFKLCLHMAFTHFWFPEMLSTSHEEWFEAKEAFLTQASTGKCTLPIEPEPCPLFTKLFRKAVLESLNALNCNYAFLISQEEFDYDTMDGDEGVHQLSVQLCLCAILCGQVSGNSDKPTEQGTRQPTLSGPDLGRRVHHCAHRCLSFLLSPLHIPPTLELSIQRW